MYIRVQLVFVHAHAVLYIIFILHQTLEMEQVLVIDELPVKWGQIDTEHPEKQMYRYKLFVLILTNHTQEISYLNRFEKFWNCFSKLLIEI